MESLIQLVKQYQRSRDVAERLRLADEIVCRISPDLHRYSSRRAPESMVDDILQQSLVAIVLSLDAFEGETDAQFWAYCYRICRNKIADALNRQEKIDAHELTGDEIMEAVAATEAAQPLSPEERLSLKMTLELLQAVRPPCLDYLWSRYIEDRSYAEMAEEFGFPSEDAARMAVKRCLLLARELMEE